MRIHVYRSGEYWRADPTDMPGCPPVGIGHNPCEAVGSLIMAMRHDPTWVGLGWPDFQITVETERSPGS